jgi:tetratricopeptide (TPR) repeat protein
MEAYGEGLGLLQAGEPLEAAERFAAAAAADPGHPLLVSWQAYALAAGGQREEAIALLQAAPGARLPEDLYNLGAWNARLGREEEALTWLGQAVTADPSLRDRLVGDPDLSNLQARIGGLAAAEEPVRALMNGEEGAILAGESYDLELVVQGGSGRALLLGWEEPLPGGFSLRRAVDEVSGGQGDAGAVRSLSWRVRAAVPGEGTLGPWTLAVGEGRHPLPAVTWQVLLPEGVEPPPVDTGAPLDPAWWTPREALAGLAAPTAAWRHGALAVLFSPGDSVDVTPVPACAAFEIELRRDDQAETLARVWPLPAGGAAPRVRVVRGGKVLSDQRVVRGR